MKSIKSCQDKDSGVDTAAAAPDARNIKGMVSIGKDSPA